MFTVRVNKPRPDFRVFIDLLYGHDHNVDIDGDSFRPESREWRQLYIKDRESDEPSVEILALSKCSQNDQLEFEIISESERLEELSAIYLYKYCGQFISKSHTPLNDEEINFLINQYSININVANSSLWHQSSESNPYPNIT